MTGDDYLEKQQNSASRAFIGPGMAVRRLRIAAQDCLWLRSILEAYDGLSSFYGGGDGMITLITPESQAASLDALIDDLAGEISLQKLP